MNDSGDREDQDRWDRTLLCSSDRLAIVTQRSIAIPSSIAGDIYSYSNDRNDYMETRRKCDSRTLEGFIITGYAVW